MNFDMWYTNKIIAGIESSVFYRSICEYLMGHTSMLSDRDLHTEYETRKMIDKPWRLWPILTEISTLTDSFTKIMLHFFLFLILLKILKSIIMKNKIKPKWTPHKIVFFTQCFLLQQGLMIYSNNNDLIF